MLSLHNSVHSPSNMCLLTHIVSYVLGIGTQICVLWTPGAHFIWMEEYCFPWLSTVVLKGPLSPQRNPSPLLPHYSMEAVKACSVSFTDLPLSHLLYFPLVYWSCAFSQPIRPPICPHSPCFHFLHFNPILPLLASSCMSSFFAPESLVLGCPYLQNSSTYACPDNAVLRKPPCITWIGTNYSLPYTSWLHFYPGYIKSL